MDIPWSDGSSGGAESQLGAMRIASPRHKRLPVLVLILKRAPFLQDGIERALIAYLSRLQSPFPKATFFVAVGKVTNSHNRLTFTLGRRKKNAELPRVGALRCIGPFLLAQTKRE